MVALPRLNLRVVLAQRGLRGGGGDAGVFRSELGALERAGKFLELRLGGLEFSFGSGDASGDLDGGLRAAANLNPALTDKKAVKRHGAQARIVRNEGAGCRRVGGKHDVGEEPRDGSADFRYCGDVVE